MIHNNDIRPLSTLVFPIPKSIHAKMRAEFFSLLVAAMATEISSARGISTRRNKSERVRALESPDCKDKCVQSYSSWEKEACAFSDIPSACLKEINNECYNLCMWTNYYKYKDG